MELRARIRPNLRRAALTAAFGALLLPALGGVADAKTRRAKLPVVTSVSPMNAAIGQTLTIRGRNFLRGRNKDTVIFKRDGAKAVFVKAQLGTAKQLQVTLPSSLAPLLFIKNGAPTATRFRIRVLAKRLSKVFTSDSRSPLVGPPVPPAPPAPPQANPDGDCDGDGVLNKVDTDDDNDLLPDTQEKALGTDPCKADTDGVGVEDGYEYRSALDLNDSEDQEPNTFLPYPGKRPYPNPLDGSDANTDFDGDSLTLGEEYSLWVYTTSKEGWPRDLNNLSYSDGEQYTMSRRGADGRRVPTLAAGNYDKQADFMNWAAQNGYATVMLAAPGADWFTSRQPYSILDDNRDGVVTTTPAAGYIRAESSYADMDGNGWLDDAERDEDADGLTNFQETRGCMNSGYWEKLYNKETKYYLPYSGTSLVDADTDGDGVRDGADDQDHDDLPNMMECSRNMASGTFDPRPPLGDPPPHPAISFLNPYNPCLPSTSARTCNTHAPLDSPWAPFNAQDKYFYIWN